MSRPGALSNSARIRCTSLVSVGPGVSMSSSSSMRSRARSEPRTRLGEVDGVVSEPHLSPTIRKARASYPGAGEARVRGLSPPGGPSLSQYSQLTSLSSFASHSCAGGKTVAGVHSGRCVESDMRSACSRTSCANTAARSRRRSHFSDRSRLRRMARGLPSFHEKEGWRT